LTDSVHDNKLKILGKLAASLSHEIKNPLSVLKLNLDYLKMSSEKFDNETNECIDASLEAADIINQLIHNTLEFSRKNKEGFEECNINEIINKAINITKGNANKRNISFQVNMSETLDSIVVNETNILQVLVNIISNGLEASNNDSKIMINSFSENNKVCVDIIDEGSGITEEDRTKVFDEFYTQKEGGTGLGLSVCKTILNEHEAIFSLNNNPEKGTRFRIEFKSNGEE
jgi:signal transduction histidine kinase